MVLADLGAYVVRVRRPGGLQMPSEDRDLLHRGKRIVDLDVNCRVNQEEIFGPVVTITPFRTEEQVVRYANAASFGLSASLWTRDLERAHRVAERLECGTVWVNCWLLRDLRTPFGGVKQSGVGREGGDEALRFFTEPKTVCIKYDAGLY